jgi:hypothetical protein
MKTYLITCLILQLGFFKVGYSQKPDSLSIIKEFITVSNSVRQYPLQLQLKLTSSSSFPTSQQDTTSGEVSFVIRPDGAYIRFGEIEQIVSDSIAVLVSHSLNRIVIWPDAANIRAKMKELSGVTFLESSIASLSEQYRPTIVSESNSERSINLTSRNTLYNTEFPKEEILLRFGKSSGEPISVIHLKRKIVVLEQEVFDNLNLQEQYKKMLFRNDKVGYFLVKENSTEFFYQSINRELKNLPVSISDRVSKGTLNNYVPAKGFESYSINVINY